MSAVQLVLFECISPEQEYGYKLLEELVLEETDSPQESEVQQEVQPNIEIAFNKDAFEKPEKPSQETMRSLYIGNLLRKIFVFYGGNLALLAAYETPDDWREEKKRGLRGDFERKSDGTPVGQLGRVREHYPENPPLSVGACRELATRIIDAGRYEEAARLYQKASYNESSRSKVDELCEDYGTRPDGRGKMHEELFTFYLMRKETENQEELPFVSKIDTGKNRNYCAVSSTNPKTALCAFKRSSDFT